MLRVFGLERPSFRFVCKAIGMLFLFGLSVNGAYEAYHLIFLEETLCHGIGGIGQIIICLLPLGVFTWIMYAYLAKKYGEEAMPPKYPTFRPRLGIILSLSIPRVESFESLKALVDATTEESLEKNIFGIIGLGNFARAVYKHKEKLRHVWMLTSDVTEPYIGHYEYFLKKFMPDAAISFVDDDETSTKLDSSSDMRSIESAKDIVAKILSAKNLERMALSKSDVVVDVTGGTKMISIGMVFGAFQKDMDFQYVEQKSHEVVTMQIPVEIVLDKVAAYLQEIHDANCAGGAH